MNSEKKLDNVIKDFTYYIDNVIMNNKERSFSYVHYLLLKSVGIEQNLSYEHVDVITGFGISFFYDIEKYWLGYFAPNDAIRRLEKYYGVKYDWKKQDTPDEMWDLVKASIDIGKPVQIPWTEESLIVGYRVKDDEKEILVMCNPFANPPQWWNTDEMSKWIKSPHSGGGWAATVDINEDSTLDKKLFYKSILELIIQLSSNDPRSEKPIAKGSKWGLEAMEQYANDVNDPKKEASFFVGGFNGCHSIVPQLGGRQSTASFISMAIEDNVFEKTTNEKLYKIAQLYRISYGEWIHYTEYLGRKQPKKDSWSDMYLRKKGADAIFKALDSEKDAINLLRSIIDEI